MSQLNNIRDHLNSGRKITPLQALSRYGSFRLSARVLDLRNEGMAIQKKMVKRNGKYFAEYRL